MTGPQVKYTYTEWLKIPPLLAVEMYGDLMFTGPCDLTVRALAKSMDCPIYYYLYNYKGELQP